MTFLFEGERSIAVRHRRFIEICCTGTCVVIADGSNGIGESNRPLSRGIFHGLFADARRSNGMPWPVGYGSAQDGPA